MEAGGRKRSTFPLPSQLAEAYFAESLLSAAVCPALPSLGSWSLRRVALIRGHIYKAWCTPGFEVSRPSELQPHRTAPHLTRVESPRSRRRAILPPLPSYHLLPPPLLEPSPPPTPATPPSLPPPRRCGRHSSSLPASLSLPASTPCAVTCSRTNSTRTGQTLRPAD